MKKNKILLSIALTLLSGSQLFADVDINGFKMDRLPSTVLSVSNGGDIPDDVAIKDGSGTFVMTPANGEKPDFRNMNQALVNHSTEATNEDKSVRDLYPDAFPDIKYDFKKNTLSFLPSTYNNYTDFNEGWVAIAYPNGTGVFDIVNDVQIGGQYLSDKDWSYLKKEMKVGVTGYMPSTGKYFFFSKETLSNPGAQVCVLLPDDLSANPWFIWIENGCSIGGIDYTYIKMNQSGTQRFRNSGIDFDLTNMSKGSYVDGDAIYYIK